MIIINQVHFSKDMWENVQIFEKNKLKPNAIPTVVHRSPVTLPLNGKQKAKTIFLL